MDARRWEEVDHLLQSALGMPPERREEFLRQASSGDTALECEVRSLLRSHREAGSFLDGLAVEAAARAQADSQRDLDRGASLLPGSTVSHHRMVAFLGSGAMGQVYEALDLNLGRRVALKFLPDDVSGDATAIERLRHEACAASALNHPNICTIHEIGEENGRPFIAMELLEGASLRESISGHPLEAQRVVRLGIELSDALATAHAAGIVHRDVKPGNIFVTRRGHAKLLDFGLAKLEAKAGTAAGEQPSEDGTTAGTVSYMSPEQVRGETLDGRTDLFSLGVVLYEMATGVLPFRGRSTGEICDTILHAEPVPPSRLNGGMPLVLEGIIGKALEKDRTYRYQRASDLGADLERLKRDIELGRARQGIARWRVRAGLAAAGAIAVIATIAAALFIQRSPSLTDRDTIVLADFRNATADPVFDDTLRQALSIALHQSPFLALISDDRIRQTFRLMRQPADAHVTPDLAREICQRTGSAAMLTGSIASLGKHYVLGLRAENCRTGDILDEEQAEAANKEGVLGALDELARQFRTRMGEARASLASHDVPLASATTSSLDALKAYSTGLKLEDTKGANSEIPFFERAIELDPQFASAYAALALSHSANGEKVLADELGEKAYHQRARTSDDERYFITAFYDLRVITNMEKGLRVLEAWEQTYPREALPHEMLGGIAWPELGDYERAIHEEISAVRAEPESGTGYLLLARADLFAGRIKDASHVVLDAFAHGFESDVFPMLRYDIGFLNGNTAEMARAFSSAPKDSPLIRYREAFVRSYGGGLREATEVLSGAAALARASGSDDRAALYESPAAIWEALFGEAQSARASAVRLLAAVDDPDVSYAAGFALALAGDSARAEGIAKNLDARWPEDTSVQTDYLPAIRGLIALDRGDPKKAIETLRTTLPYDLAAPRIRQHAFFGALYPVYVRGLAYLAAHEGAQAATEFRNILSHRGLVVSDPVGALAHLELGRAYALQGDLRDARAAYRDFLALWKNADTDLPILQQARLENANIH